MYTVSSSSSSLSDMIGLSAGFATAFFAWYCGGGFSTTIFFGGHFTLFGTHDHGFGFAFIALMARTI
jgi:hypothetical protein